VYSKKIMAPPAKRSEWGPRTAVFHLYLYPCCWVYRNDPSKNVITAPAMTTSGKMFPSCNALAPASMVALDAAVESDAMLIFTEFRMMPETARMMATEMAVTTAVV